MKKEVSENSSPAKASFRHDITIPKTYTSKIPVVTANCNIADMTERPNLHIGEKLIAPSQKNQQINQQTWFAVPSNPLICFGAISAIYIGTCQRFTFRPSFY